MGWTDYAKKAVIYTNPLTAGTAIGNAVYKDATGSDSLLGDITGAAKSPGYDTAAAGAKEAQAYLKQLSQQAWDRQMQGLQGALGSFGSYDALAAQMNPRHGGAPMPGGGAGPGGVPPSTGPAVEGRSGVSHFGGAGPAYTPSSGPSAEGRSGVTHFSPPDLYSPPSTGPTVEDRSGIGHFSPSAPLPPPGPVASGPLPPAPSGAPTSLPPPDILTMLASMTRAGRGHF